MFQRNNYNLLKTSCFFLKKTLLFFQKKWILFFQKNNYIANSTKKSWKLFKSESGASKIIMYIIYSLMLCIYITSEHGHVRLNYRYVTLWNYRKIFEIIDNFLKLSIVFGKLSIISKMARAISFNIFLKAHIWPPKGKYSVLLFKRFCSKNLNLNLITCRRILTLRQTVAFTGQRWQLTQHLINVLDSLLRTEYWAENEKLGLTHSIFYFLFPITYGTD